MNADALSCPRCLNLYDQTERIPRILILCGHTFCSTCTDEMSKLGEHIQCPIDGKTTDNKEAFLPNFALLQFIKMRTTEDICKIHDKKMKILCLDDRCEVCNYCVQYGDHKGHKTKLIKDAKNEVSATIKSLESALNTVNDYQLTAMSAVEMQRSSFLDLVKKKFSEVREALDTEEAQVLAEAGSFFDLEKTDLDKILGANSSVKKIITEKIDNGKAALNGNKWFRCAEELPLTSYRLVQNLVDRHSEERKMKLDELNRIFVKTLDSKKAMRRLTFPVDELKARTDTLSERVERALKTGETLVELDNLDLLALEQKGNSLEISFRNSPIVTEETSRPELDLVQYKGITSVKIDFSVGKLSEEMVMQMLKLWKFIDKVTCLEIHYLKQDPISDILDNLVFLLGHTMKNVQNVEFRIHSSDLDDQGLSSLLAPLTPIISNISSLVLDFAHTMITGSSLEGLVADKGFETWKDIEHLEISLAHTQIRDDNFMKLLLPNMKSIKSLKLNLLDTNLTEASIQAIPPTLNNTLQHFEIHLNNSKISDYCLLQFVSKELPALRSLVLDMSNTQVSDQIVKAFAVMTLASMTALEYLELGFNSTRVTDQSIQIFLATNLSNIKIFKLALSNCKISDSSLEVFGGHSLEKMKNLEYLELDVSSTLITDKGLLAMFANSLASVKYLYINANSTKITNKSVETFANVTSKTMKILKEVKIDTQNTLANKHVRKVILQ